LSMYTGWCLCRRRGLRLTDAVLGEPIKDIWWTHAESRWIFAIPNLVAKSEDVQMCRLISGKIMLVHRDLWPALVRLADRFLPKQLAQVREEHTPSDRCDSYSQPYPARMPADVVALAEKLDDDTAIASLRIGAPLARSVCAVLDRRQRAGTAIACGRRPAPYVKRIFTLPRMRRKYRVNSFAHADVQGIATR
jgi:hypothetical protein